MSYLPLKSKPLFAKKKWEIDDPYYIWNVKKVWQIIFLMGCKSYDDMRGWIS